MVDDAVCGGEEDEAAVDPVAKGVDAAEGGECVETTGSEGGEADVTVDAIEDGRTWFVGGTISPEGVSFLDAFESDSCILSLFVPVSILVSRRRYSSKISSATYAVTSSRYVRTAIGTGLLSGKFRVESEVIEDGSVEDAACVEEV